MSIVHSHSTQNVHISPSLAVEILSLILLNPYKAVHVIFWWDAWEQSSYTWCERLCWIFIENPIIWSIVGLVACKLCIVWQWKYFRLKTHPSYGIFQFPFFVQIKIKRGTKYPRKGAVYPNNENELRIIQNFSKLTYQLYFWRYKEVDYSRRVLRS